MFRYAIIVQFQSDPPLPHEWKEANVWIENGLHVMLTVSKGKHLICDAEIHLAQTTLQ